MRIRDIVDVRARPSVVRLEEAARGELASYHVTPEVQAHVERFRALLQRVRREAKTN